MEIILAVLTLLIVLIVAFLFAVAVIVARMVHPPKQTVQPQKQLSEEEKRKAERLRLEVINMLSYVGEPQEEIHID